MLERRYSDIVKRLPRVRNNSLGGKQQNHRHQETLSRLAYIDNNNNNNDNNGRHVTFGETKFVEIERCLPTEKRLIWYSMKEFQSSYNFEVSENWRRHAEKNAKNNNDDSWTWRGMEHVVSGTSKSDRVRHVVTEVLKYQSSKKEGKKSASDVAVLEEALRQYSRTKTKQDRIAAEKMGSADARAVGHEKGKHSKTNFVIQGTKSIVHAIQRTTTMHKAATQDFSSRNQQQQQQQQQQLHSDSKTHDSSGDLKSKDIQSGGGDEPENPKTSLKIWSSPRDMEKFFLRKIRRTVRKDDLNTSS